MVAPKTSECVISSTLTPEKGKIYETLKKASLNLKCVGKNLLVPQMCIVRERSMCMSNIKANIRGLKEMNSCKFVGVQAKTALITAN